MTHRQSGGSKRQTSHTVVRWLTKPWSQKAVSKLGNLSLLPKVTSPVTLHGAFLKNLSFLQRNPGGWDPFSGTQEGAGPCYIKGSAAGEPLQVTSNQKWVSLPRRCKQQFVNFGGSMIETMQEEGSSWHWYKDSCWAGEMAQLGKARLGSQLKIQDCCYFYVLMFFCL